MELLLELAFTIALSLLLPLVFIKIFSVTPNFEANKKVVVIGRDHDDHDHGVKSEWETEEIVRIVGKIDEFRDKPILGKLIVPEIVDTSCESPEKRDSGKIDENRVYSEIELEDLAEDPVAGKINELEVENKEWESRGCEVDEVVEILQCERDCDEVDESDGNTGFGENREFVVDEEDWEGIERTELEKRFGAAVAFVGSKSNLNLIVNLSNDAKMKLHGYHRIATQGPCQEPQPMVLKFSARAKWTAWRQLGIMTPEQAMEHYISLLSESIPNWMANHPYDNAKPASAELT
ncbi:hypothetical protein RJT34_05690 [Clitoria ternatea]|uniref:ACB domain-containing protein n=1 Tax=Clitoria ternatea TaxID=43366 RepID=A0AAN9PTU2_CLITE